MNKVNVGTFIKTILPSAKEYIVTPYASEEFNLYGRIIVVSDKVTEPTMLVKRVNSDKAISYILPKIGELKEVMSEHKDIISNHMKVSAPYFGVFNMKRECVVNEVRM